MANKKIYELEELTTPVSDDLLLINQSSTSKDKKVKMSNLVSNDTIESAVDDWLDAHPEATTTVEDGSITPAKLHQDTLDMFDEKADIDGYYEDMSVGSAEQLLSNMFEDDSDPYLFRSTAGSKEVGDRVYEDAIVGGSVAWNQLVQNGDFSDGTTGWSPMQNTTSEISVSDSILTVTAKVAPTTVYALAASETLASTKIAGHKYVFRYDVKADRPFTIYNSWLTGNTTLLPSNQWNTQFFIWAAPSSSTKKSNYLGIGNYSDFGQGDSFQIRKSEIFDLTLAFGSTIADYAYSLEQATAGSGIAWLKSQGFFTKDYYAYNAGSIQSVKTSAKKVTGFNQFDKSTAVTYQAWIHATSNGYEWTKASDSSKSFAIKCLPNTSYYFGIGSVSSAVFRIGSIATNDLPTDSTWSVPLEKEFISGKNQVYTTGVNAKWLVLQIDSTKETEIKENLRINFHWDGERDGEYEPYVEHTYPLDSDLELRGIPKLDSANKLYYDGDTYESDGTVTRRYGIVDLGTLNWAYNSTAQRFTASFSSKASTWEKANAVCGKYVIGTWGVVQADTTKDKVFSLDGSYVMVRDFAYSDAATFKTAMSGVYLVYELATPTTESADPYTNPQLVDNWGTEQFVDERDVPVPVGHDSRYLPDLKAKLESAPNNPSTNGKYFLQYQNGEATYVPVPSEVPQTPSEDGTYVLKATVSGGTATLSWVAES